ncbi:MAG: hypothetical protein ACLGGX_10030 [Bdellovibrionia bacterium]
MMRCLFFILTLIVGINFAQGQVSAGNSSINHKKTETKESSLLLLIEMTGLVFYNTWFESEFERQSKDQDSIHGKFLLIQLSEFEKQLEELGYFVLNPKERNLHKILSKKYGKSSLTKTDLTELRTLFSVNYILTGKLHYEASPGLQKGLFGNLKLYNAKNLNVLAEKIINVPSEVLGIENPHKHLLSLADFIPHVDPAQKAENENVYLVRMKHNLSKLQREEFLSNVVSLFNNRANVTEQEISSQQFSFKVKTKLTVKEFKNTIQQLTFNGKKVSAVLSENDAYLISF